MTTDAEARIGAAFDALRDAVLAALREASSDDAPERLLSVPEAMDVLHLSRDRLYAEMGSGRLHSVKAGRRRLIPMSAVRAFAAGEVAR